MYFSNNKYQNKNTPAINILGKEKINFQRFSDFGRCVRKNYQY